MLLPTGTHLQLETLQTVSFSRPEALAHSPGHPPAPHQQCRHRGGHIAGTGYIAAESMGVSSSLNRDGAQVLRCLGSHMEYSPGYRTLGMCERCHASSLGLDENVTVLGVQHTLADELLGNRDGNVIGHTQVGEVVQEPGVVTTGVGQGTQRLAPEAEAHPPPSLAGSTGSPDQLLLLLPSQSLEMGCQGQPTGTILRQGGGRWSPEGQAKGGTRTGVIFKIFNN